MVIAKATHEWQLGQMGNLCTFNFAVYIKVKAYSLKNEKESLNIQIPF